MKYKIDILRRAQKQLAKIDIQEHPRIIAAIESLAENPRPHDCKKLTGRPAWRIRIGAYRIIYEINDEQVLIVVVAIGHRREIYQ